MPYVAPLLGPQNAPLRCLGKQSLGSLAPLLKILSGTMRSTRSVHALAEYHLRGCSGTATAAAVALAAHSLSHKSWDFSLSSAQAQLPSQPFPHVPPPTLSPTAAPWKSCCHLLLPALPCPALQLCFPCCPGRGGRASCHLLTVNHHPLKPRCQTLNPKPRDCLQGPRQTEIAAQKPAVDWVGRWGWGKSIRGRCSSCSAAP